MKIEKVQSGLYSITYRKDNRLYKKYGKTRKECRAKAIEHIASGDTGKEVEVETDHQLYINKRGLTTSHRNNISDIRIYLDSDSDAKELTRTLVKNHKNKVHLENKFIETDSSLYALELKVVNLLEYLLAYYKIDDSIPNDTMGRLDLLSKIVIGVTKE